MNSFKIFLLQLLLLLPILSLAQTDVLEKAGYYHENDQLDFARLLYQQIYETATPDDQLQAVTGLLKIAIQQAATTKADSLLQIGDQLLAAENISLKAICDYRTAKGEYFRKNARLEEALAEYQAVIGLSQKLGDESLVYPYAIFYSALTLSQQAAYDSSLVYAEQAYELFQQRLDTTDVQFSGIYNGLAVCYQRANRLAEAKTFYLKSKRIAEEKLGPVSTDLAMCLNNLSSISRAEENYREAIQYSEQALKISRALQDEQGVSSAYYALGVYHYFLGDYGRTKDYMEACIAIRKRLFSKDHFSLINPYEVLGIAHEESGDYQQTLFYLQQAGALIKVNYPEGSLREGQNYENTALVYKSLEKLDTALLYIQRASPILTRQFPANSYPLSVHHFSYANILYRLNRLPEAEQRLQQSNRIFKALGMENSTEYAQNLGLQALLAAEQNNWAEADTYFETALEVIRQPATSDSAEAGFQTTPNALWVLNEYMDYQYRKYQITGEPQALQLFETYSQLYLDLSDTFRKQFIDPYTKSVLIKDNAQVYERNIGIYQQLYHKTQEADYLKTAYASSENGRTALLRDMLDAKVVAYAGLPDSVLQREQHLKKKITELQQRLLESPEDATVKQELFLQKEALNEHIKEAEENYPRYHQLKFATRIPDLESIQKQLQSGENLVEYMQDDTAYYALVLNPEGRELVYLGNRKRIDAAIENWKTGIVTRHATRYASAGKVLYEKLWQPLETHLASERVTVVPVGALFYLNFETLPTEESYLIHAYNITYALSFTVLFSEQVARKQGDLLAIAPGFEDAIKQAYKTKLDSLELPDEDYLRTVRQPWSLKLVDKLREKFAHAAFTGLRATEANIKANIHKGKVLYFGTHAIADPDDPLRSRLVLAKEVGAQTEDGYLHAYELYGLPLEAELAVLNACESGLGNLQKGEGMISLAYSIHYAGCPSTVLSLWKVDEKVSTQITEDFLNFLDQGLSKSEALRQAKLDYLASANATLQHPFYWGGMVLMGKDGQVELGQNRSVWYLLIPLGILIVGLLYWLSWRRDKRFS